MTELTVFLAAFIALTHVVFIFWPRKRLDQPTHPDGRPILWLNKDQSRQDVACVWPAASAENSRSPASVTHPSPIADFREATPRLSKTTAPAAPAARAAA